MASIYCSLLARSGMDVAFLDPWTEAVEAIRRDGLRLRGINGDLVIPVAATTEIGEIGPVDVFIVQFNSSATAKVAPTPGPNGPE